MASTFFRDVGGGRRRAYAKAMFAALCLLLISTLAVGCNLDNPVSPNDPGDLTGQTTNQSFTFNGTIIVAASGTSITADDTESVTVVATIRDASGDPVPNLTTVTFSSNIGGFLSTDEAGNPVILPAVNATTFNGQAAATFLSRGRIAGPATITVSLGTVTGSTSVNLEIEPVRGSIVATFGPDASGAVTMTGSASSAVPLDTSISAMALDDSDSSDPIGGAIVRFRVLSDSTDETTTNEPVEFIGGVNQVTTDPDGVASTQIRVQGPGDVVIAADLIDPNTGQVVATSNNIFLTTIAAGQVPKLVLTFSDGTETQHVFEIDPMMPSPATEGVLAVATDANGNPLVGSAVRFFIVNDNAGTARFANGGTSITTTTGFGGEAFDAITLTASGQVVTIRAELFGEDGVTVVATSNVIVAIVGSG